MNPAQTADALDSAINFDPWQTIPDDHHPDLPPDEFLPSDTPPPDSIYAISDFRTPPPWGRLVSKGESSENHNAFRHYTSLGPSRTFALVAERVDASYSTVLKWAREYDWVKRASAWDKYVDEQYETELQERVKEVATRHAEHFKRALDTLAIAFDPIINDSNFAEELRVLPAKTKLQLAIQASRAMPALAGAERVSMNMDGQQDGEAGAPKFVATLDDIKTIISTLTEANVGGKDSSMVVESEIIDVEGEEVDDGR